MTRFALLLAVCISAVSPIAGAAPVTYFATLNGTSENPSNASPGTGSATVTIDTVAHTLQVGVVFNGLSAATTASHIHCCVAPPGNVGVSTTTPTFAGFPLGVTSGTYNIGLDTTQASTWNAPFITASGGTPLGAEAALAAGLAAGQAYLNIHSTVFPGGEIRGFLSPQLLPAAATNIPTLGQWGIALLVASLAVFGGSALRRRKV